MEVSEEVIVPKNRVTSSEVNDLLLPAVELSGLLNGSSQSEEKESDHKNEIPEGPTNENNKSEAKTVTGPEKLKMQTSEKTEVLNAAISDSDTASSLTNGSRKSETVTQATTQSKQNDNAEISNKNVQDSKTISITQIKPSNKVALNRRNAKEKASNSSNEKHEEVVGKLAIQEIEAKCHSLQDENESLRNQLEERERFLEDILAEIEEFKEKSKQNHNDLRVENLKLKEVNRSQMNKFSIERDFMLKENEFLKQRIEYLNEDLKFYTERQEKEVNSSEGYTNSKCFSCEAKESSVSEESGSSENVLERESLPELRSKIASLQIEVDASITLISTLENDLENRSSQLDDAKSQLDKTLETEKELETIKEALEKENRLLSDDKKELQQEIMKLRLTNDVLAEKETNFKKLSETLKEFENLVKEKNVEITELSENVSRLEKSCDLLEKQNLELTRKCGTLETEKRELVSQSESDERCNQFSQTENVDIASCRIDVSAQTLEDFSAMETSIKELNFEKEKLKRCYDEQSNVIEELETKMRRSTDEYDNLVALKITMEQQLHEKTSIIQENETTVKGLKSLLDQKTSELMQTTMDLQSWRKCSEEKISQIEKEYKEKDDHLESAVKNLQNELTKLFNEKQKVSDEFEKSKELINSLEIDLNKERCLNAQNGALIEELRMNPETETLEAQLKQMKEEVEKFQNEMLRKKSEMDNMDIKIQNLTEMLASKENEKLELVKQHDTNVLQWKKEAEVLKESLAQLEKEKVENVELIEQMENDLKMRSVESTQENDKTAEITKYEEDISLLKNEAENFRKTIEDFENERLEKSGIIQQLENDVKNGCAKIDHLESEKAEIFAKYEQDVNWWKSECEQNISQKCEMEIKLSNITEECEQKLADYKAADESKFQEMGREYTEQISDLEKKCEQLRDEKVAVEKSWNEVCLQNEQKLNNELNKSITELKKTHEKEVSELKDSADCREQLIKELEVKVNFLKESLESKEVNNTKVEICTGSIDMEDEVCSAENLLVKNLHSENFVDYGPSEKIQTVTIHTIQNSTQTTFISSSKETQTQIFNSSSEDKVLDIRAFQQANFQLSEEVETLQSLNSNLEVELTTLKAQFELEMDEAKQALYDSQQECARYQATMVQMKTHYEQTIKIMKNDKSSAIKELQNSAKDTKSDSQSRQHIKTIEELKNLKDENTKLRKKLETKVEVLDEINDKISTIASSLSIHRPFTPRRPSKVGNVGGMRQMMRNSGASSTEAADPATATPRFTSPLRLSRRTTTSEDTGFNTPTPSSSTAADMSSQETYYQIDNIKSVLQYLQSSLEGLRESSTTDSGFQGNESTYPSVTSRFHQRPTSPFKGLSACRGMQLPETHSVAGFQGANEAVNNTQVQMVELLSKKDKEIEGLRKQLDDRDEYIAHRAYATSAAASNSPTRDSRTFDNVVEENRLLRSQLDNALSMSSRNEARSNKLAKQLEDKYRTDLLTLEELQSKVVSVTNFKQREITELENTLKKIMKENKFLKEELKYIRDKKLEERRQLSSASLDMNSPDIDTNPIAFSAQLRNLYNTSPL